MGYGETALLKDVWEYDSATGIWTRRNDFPGDARAAVFSFVIGYKAYVGGGFISDPNTNHAILREFWEYDPATDKWTKKADCPGEGIRGATGFGIGGEGFAGTGYRSEEPKVPGDNGDRVQKDFWKYNPATNTWAKIADFPGCPRAFSSAFVINGLGYLGTGSTGIVGNRNTKDFYKYNPLTDEWTRIADFGGGERADAVSFSIAGKVIPAPDTANHILLALVILMSIKIFGNIILKRISGFERLISLPGIECMLPDSV